MQRRPFSTLVLVCALTACGIATRVEPEPAAAHDGLTVRITVPASTPDTATVYIAGPFNNWQPGHPSYALTRETADTWSIDLPPTVRGAVEFKFTLGAWDLVETNAAGGDVPNRQLDVPAQGPVVHETAVAGWRSVEARPAAAHTATESVSILDDAFEMPQLGRTRRVWLYLPPDYATSGDRRYPVLYMHDGQNVFDVATSYIAEWGVDETLDSLHAAGELSLIVVAVDHGGTERFDEYNPWSHPDYGGERGDEYVDFLVQTLKPYVDAHYRTLPDRLNTGVAGSSMGGLISFHAIMKYPDVFGRAGVFSPAFWIAKPQVFEYAAARSPVRPDPRIFFVSGALEDGLAEPGDYERDQIAMVDTLAARGWTIGTDAEVVAFIRADGTHSEWFWRREFPTVVKWLFDAR